MVSLQLSGAVEGLAFELSSALLFSGVASLAGRVPVELETVVLGRSALCHW